MIKVVITTITKIYESCILFFFSYETLNQIGLRGKA